MPFLEAVKMLRACKRWDWVLSIEIPRSASALLKNGSVMKANLVLNLSSNVGV